MMQVQHEAHLIEANPLRPPQENQILTNGYISDNKSLDYYTITSSANSPLGGIENISSCPVNNLVAVHLTSSNQLVMYDTRSHVRRDRFPLKACDKKFSRQSFQVSGLDFSQDGQRLAVAQTDCIIYIYKFTFAGPSSPVQAPQQPTLGQPVVSSGNLSGPSSESQATSSSFKPSITGKFASSSPITCLIWRDLGILFGSQDGRVKLITMSSASNYTQGQPSKSSGVPDHLPVTTSNSPSVVAATSSQPSKVVNVFAPQRAGSMPISLAYRSPILLIGLTDNTVQIMSVSSEQQVAVPPGTLSTNEATHELSLTHLAQQQSQTRRNSSQPPLAITPVGLIEHSCPPGHLKILPDYVICCAGSDGQLAFHSTKLSSNYDSLSPKTSTTRRSSQPHSLLYTIDLNEDIMALDYSSINEVLAIATRSRLLFAKLDQESSQWRLQGSSIELTSTGNINSSRVTPHSRLKSSMVSLTSLAWTRDGTQLLVGCSNGSLELFKCIYNKQSISDQLDICHIAKNRVRITDRERNLLATYKTQSDIKRVNLLDNGQSVIIWTLNSLLLARLNDAHLQSEIQWSQRAENKNVRFLFSSDSFVLLFRENNRELRIIKLGSTNNPKYSRKFNSINKKLISIREFPSFSYQSSSGSWSPQQKLTPHRGTSGVLRSVGSAASQRSSIQPRHSSSAHLTLTSELGDLLTAQNQYSPNDHPQVVDNSGLTRESLYERFAFVDPANLKEVNIVDLKEAIDSSSGQTNKIHTQSDIISIEFSHTSRYLALRDSALKLHLIEMPDMTGHKINLLVDRCEFAGWLPGTDSLVAQSGHQIQLRLDLSQPKRVDIYDSRTFNINMSPPLIDISLLSTPSDDLTSGKPYPRVSQLTSDQIKLTNGQSIQLDSFKIKFYAHLINGRLVSAFELLERQEMSPSTTDHSKQLIRNLYAKLGWFLVEDERQRDCELALKVFTRLNYASLCSYLSQCVASSEPLDIEKELRLTTLCGQWDRFETLAEPERIVSTYKRLNKWLRCIKYLERSQKYRQRDIAEQEHIQWLISRSRHLEAAKILANTTGDLAGALELLMTHELFVEAGQLFLSQQKAPLLLNQSSGEKQQRLAKLAESLLGSLLDSNKYLVAAQLSEKLQGDTTKALELYLKAEAFNEALDLINNSSKSDEHQRIAARKGEIQFLFGANLEQQYKSQRLGRRKASKAIELYLESGHPFEAFKFALDLKLHDRAFQILTEQLGNDQTPVTDQLREQCSRLGAIFRQQVERRQDALKAYELASDYDQMIELLIELGDFERAFQVSLEQVHSNDRQKTTDKFAELAQAFVSSNRDLDKAEKIYLLLERPELAIEMYKQAEQYDKMLDLIGKYRADQLEGSLLHLARQLEAESKFGEAEKYLLRASPNEWTNVVRMYRLASMWPDAYRVARANCTSDQDPLLVQLAYWWSKSLLTSSVGGSDQLAKGDTTASEAANKSAMMNQARKLLIDLNVLTSVIEFCCETQNYLFAIELSRTNEQLKDQVVLRYAKYLEQQNKFDRAEQVLLENNLVDAAVKMYLDNEKQAEAISLIERQLQQSDEPELVEVSAGLGRQPRRRSQLVDLLNSTLIECANKLASNSETGIPATNKATNQLNKNQLTIPRSHLDQLQVAQQMYLRAQRPDLAIEMYRGRGMWQEAIQVAQRFAPRLLESIERELDEQVSDDIEPILRAFPAKEQPGEKSDQETTTNGVVVEEKPRLQRAVPLLESPTDQLRFQLEHMIRSGENRNEARIGLSRFLANLWNQVDRDRLSAKSIGEALTQVGQLVGQGRDDALELADLKFAGLGNQDNLAIVASLADVVFLNIDWQSDLNWLVWLNLRQTLEACWCSVLHLEEQQPTASSGASPDDGVSAMALGAWEDEAGSHQDELLDKNKDQSKMMSSSAWSRSLAPLERRLLVAHYVALHCGLVGQLQSQLLSSAASQRSNGSSGGSVFRSRPHYPLGQASRQVNLASPLSISQLEQLSSSLRDQQTAGGRHEEENKATGVLVDLLSKLSLSLLRYTYLVDTLRALYFAGLWQVAAGRKQLARTIWSLLIELADEDNTNEQDLMGTARVAETSPNRAALERLVDLPRRLRLSKVVVQRKQQQTMGSSEDLMGGVTSEQLAEVRQWLLETLIERLPGQSDSVGELSAKMSDYLAPDYVKATCLVSGLPAMVKPNPAGNNDNHQQDDHLILGARFNRWLIVRRPEWTSLLECVDSQASKTKSRSRANLHHWTPQSQARRATNTARPLGASDNLNNVVEFLIRLSGGGGGGGRADQSAPDHNK